MDEEYLKRLVAMRLKAIPPNVSFSIGRFGDFSRDELIREVERGSNVGKATIQMELTFLREMPNLSEKIGTSLSP